VAKSKTIWIGKALRAVLCVAIVLSLGTSFVPAENAPKDSRDSVQIRTLGSLSAAFHLNPRWQRFQGAKHRVGADSAFLLVPAGRSLTDRGRLFEAVEDTHPSWFWAVDLPTGRSPPSQIS
jgi:hypothetical protein